MKGFEKTYDLREIPLNKIRAHPKIQRGFRSAHAKGILNNFDPDYLGELYVVPDPRKPGYFLVFDGQHRHWAALQYFNGDGRQQVPCRVYRDMTSVDLARVARGVNNTRRWSALDEFRLDVFGEEKTAVSITAILKKYGLRVDGNMSEGAVRAVDACTKIAEKDPARLDEVISVLHAAWGPHPDAYHQCLLKGVSLVLSYYNGSLDRKALAAKMAKAGGPGQFQGNIKSLAAIRKTNVSRAAAMLLVDEYNKGRSTGRLSEFGVKQSGDKAGHDFRGNQFKKPTA